MKTTDASDASEETPVALPALVSALYGTELADDIPERARGARVYVLRGTGRAAPEVIRMLPHPTVVVGFRGLSKSLQRTSKQRQALYSPVAVIGCGTSP